MGKEPVVKCIVKGAKQVYKVHEVLHGVALM